MENVLKKIAVAQEALAEAVSAIYEMDVTEDAIEEEEAVRTNVLDWGDGTFTDLDAMKLPEIKAFAKSAEIKIVGKTVEAIAIEIYDAYNPPADEEAEEEEAEAEAEEVEEEALNTVVTVLDADGEPEEIDLAGLDLKGVKAFAVTYGIALTTKTKDDIIAEIINALYGEAEPEEEDAEDSGEEEGQNQADFYGLTDMSNEDLANTLAGYGLSPKGKREALIDRVLVAIQDGTIKVESGE